MQQFGHAHVCSLYRWMAVSVAKALFLVYFSNLHYNNYVVQQVFEAISDSFVIMQF